MPRSKVLKSGPGHNFAKVIKISILFFFAYNLCHFTAKDLKGVHFVLLIANPFLNLSPSGRLWHKYITLSFRRYSEDEMIHERL
jgi:hypothetical protein